MDLLFYFPETLKILCCSLNKIIVGQNCTEIYLKFQLKFIKYESNQFLEKEKLNKTVLCICPFRPNSQKQPAAAELA